MDLSQTSRQFTTEEVIELLKSLPRCVAQLQTRVASDPDAFYGLSSKIDYDWHRYGDMIPWGEVTLLINDLQRGELPKDGYTDKLYTQAEERANNK